jgi:hypothetical protein
MGIFDIFTGAPAKDAAAKNSAALAANKAEGTGILNTGQTNSLASLDKAGGYYAPLSQKYGQGTNLYLDSLGVNGPEGNTRATGAFQAGPGYQYQVQQALDQTNRAAAATGGLQGGNTLAALSDRAGNMANQEYGNWQTRLGGLINPELAATTGQASAEVGKVPVYQGTANSLVGLGTNTTNGINSQTTQAANAQMAGSANLWNLGLQGATALASGGGTGLLGGGGGKGLGSLFMGGGSPSGY